MLTSKDSQRSRSQCSSLSVPRIISKMGQISGPLRGQASFSSNQLSLSLCLSTASSSLVSCSWRKGLCLCFQSLLRKGLTPISCSISSLIQTLRPVDVAFVSQSTLCLQLRRPRVVLRFGPFPASASDTSLSHSGLGIFGGEPSCSNPNPRRILREHFLLKILLLKHYLV